MTLEDVDYTLDDVCEAVDCLAPLMPRVYAMEFTTNVIQLNDLVPGLLGCWVQHGSIGTAKVLELNVPTDGETVELELKDVRVLMNSSPEKFKAFFHSLHTLSLANARLDWRLGFYSGLVNLCLGEMGRRGYRLGGRRSGSYSQWEIAAILAASPRLHSLVIIGLDIVIDRRNGGMPDAVALNDLNLLRLESSASQNLWTVLRMVMSTSHSIRMSLSFENRPEFIPAARSFFERCKVTALHINSSYYPVSSLFTYMPHLKLLAIQSYLIFDKTWPDSTHSDGGSLDLWPRLDELYLVECDAGQETLSRLVSIHAPRILRVFKPDWNAEARDQAEEMLRPHAVRLVWFDSWADAPAESQKVATGRFV